MTVRNLSDLDESDFKREFNSFGRNATRFGMTENLDFTSENMMRETALAYRVTINKDFSITVPELKKGIESLFKAYQLMCDKAINDRLEAERAAEPRSIASEN